VSDTAIRYGEGRSVHGEGCPKNGRSLNVYLQMIPNSVVVGVTPV